MDKIVVGELRIDSDDLSDMNKTELVKICRMLQHPAHRGVEKKTLISLIKGKKRKVRNNIDTYRESIISFLKNHWDAVSSQVDVKCHGDCTKHTDFQVVTCWKTNKEILEKYQ